MLSGTGPCVVGTAVNTWTNGIESSLDATEEPADYTRRSISDLTVYSHVELVGPLSGRSIIKHRHRNI